jgi:hypothetical protein
MPTHQDACDAACQVLWPDPTAPAPADAVAHYRRCHPCQQFFVRERHLEQRLACLCRPIAPAAVRERIAAQLEKEAGGSY